MISTIRREIVGPADTSTGFEAAFSDDMFEDQASHRNGQVYWMPGTESRPEEVIFYQRESPHRKYGAGRLHPIFHDPDGDEASNSALQASDVVGMDEELDDADGEVVGENDELDARYDEKENGDEFQVSDGQSRYVSSMGITFCARLESSGLLIVHLPQEFRFSWQNEDEPPFQVNGRYEPARRTFVSEKGRSQPQQIWRRLPAVPPNTQVEIPADKLLAGQLLTRKVQTSGNPDLSLYLDVFPRVWNKSRPDSLIVTVVLRNRSDVKNKLDEQRLNLFQTFFSVSVNKGVFEKYPEPTRSFEKLDFEEQSLSLLYRDSSTWAIGHGCAACWGSTEDSPPEEITADVLPATELPSMTPDVEVDAQQLTVKMRDLFELDSDGTGPGWDSLKKLVRGYEQWIVTQKERAEDLEGKFTTVSAKHLEKAEEACRRIKRGLELVRADEDIRNSFRAANMAMLLQQISMKVLSKRALTWRADARQILPEEPYRPASLVLRNDALPDGIGSWRTFQIAFLLMSIEGITDESSADRDAVDLIWFPTGGGKTEAYLGLIAFYLFHQRRCGDERDGTNVLMRYTLRMLTTQQFQRAASLICAMEHLRKNAQDYDLPVFQGARFSLGLWLGQEGTPNKVSNVGKKIGEYERGKATGNPLVVTECPWCRSEIGRYSGPKPRNVRDKDWHRVRGINRQGQIYCPDVSCEFSGASGKDFVPVEVVDERIYSDPPSFIISTADKLAMLAYRPGDEQHAGTSRLFGRKFVGGKAEQVKAPPGLIVQDELHLISGPLGTVYALYEGMIEALCTRISNGQRFGPKIIASTATIRGADAQVRALYDREDTRLFPPPGLDIGDSFFGKHAKKDGVLEPGRLYLGVHAADYNSLQTTQVRTFSAALFGAYKLSPDRRDPWWTLLAFYNSIRELSGAYTLFDSDIRSRLKMLFNREGNTLQDRRRLKIIKELTSRLSQAEIVGMLDGLSNTHGQTGREEPFDVCLASSIVEVGVDIDRLSLMGVVGQPKTTASYIQVTGRVGRRWWDRPGLILTVYSPSKSRDRSHYEQFESYHRRLYEHVEPTSATPFAVSAIERALSGVLIAWARQHFCEPAFKAHDSIASIEDCYTMLVKRCRSIQQPEDQNRSIQVLTAVKDRLVDKWRSGPQAYERFPPDPDEDYLMLWPGQYSTARQKRIGEQVPSSMRQVDRAGKLQISEAYLGGDE